ncbi:MAG: xanthine dehydrogenase family protein subunit M [Caldilineaceae bacterium]|nr:xanthine dehydrogenase family protein subunit M [Caldilineaceae bacterium]
MKPAPFEYFAPTSVDEALKLLDQHGYDAKVIAGGQSLVPTMNFRLAQPAVLIDLNRIDTLSFIRVDPQGALAIGAMTRQSQVERSPLVAERAPLLSETMPYIAHRQIRNRGTIGGSLAHADPAAELPAVMTALDARFRIRDPQGQERLVPAQDFYIGLFTTALAPNELLTEITIPSLPPRSGWSMQEIARRMGDYAIVGVAARVTLDQDGRCAEAQLVYLSVGEGPVAARQAMASLRGQRPTTALIDQAGAMAANDDIEPTADIHASVAYRRQLAHVLGVRALRTAFTRAGATVD